MNDACDWGLTRKCPHVVSSTAVSTGSNPIPRDHALVDSGSVATITPSSRYLSAPQTAPARTFRGASGISFTGPGVTGTLQLANVNGEAAVSLHSAEVTPSLTETLVSTWDLATAGLDVWHTATDRKVRIGHLDPLAKNVVKVEGQGRNGVYRVPIAPPSDTRRTADSFLHVQPPSNAALHVQSWPGQITADVLHERFAHRASSSTIAKTAKCTRGMPPIPADAVAEPCESCVLAKITIAPYPLNDRQEDIHGFHVSADTVFPPRPIPGIGGFTGLLHLVIRNIGFRVAYPLRSKTEVGPYLQYFTRWIKNLTGKPIIAVRMDQGRENKNTNVQTFFRDAGIPIEWTEVQAHQQNALVEGAHRHLFDNVRAQLIARNLPLDLWALAALNDVHVSNRILHGSADKTPYELLTGRQPSVAHIRVFGSKMIGREPANPNKLKPRGVKGTYVGSAENDGHPELKRAFLCHVPGESLPRSFRDAWFDERAVTPGQPSDFEALDPDTVEFTTIINSVHEK